MFTAIPQDLRLINSGLIAWEMKQKSKLL